MYANFHPVCQCSHAEAQNNFVDAQNNFLTPSRRFAILSVENTLMSTSPDNPHNSLPFAPLSVPVEREDIEDAPFWEEVAAFNQIPQSIVDEYYGKYIAVYGGNIVDSDPDEGELALRFYRTFGYVPVYIHQVGTEDGLIDPHNV